MKDALGFERIWRIKKNSSDLPSEISKVFNLKLLTAQILVHRGCDSPEKAEKFLSLRLRDLSDPFFLTDMPDAVNRVLLAIEKKEKILVHGDYDVDGITGTAILCDFFRRVGVHSVPYIPDRVTEGYGISREAIEKASRENFTLMISVDCGGSAFEEIDLAVQKGLHFIVVDHHEIKERTPRCLAFIHPRRTDHKVDFDHLAAVGTAFKLLHGIMKKASENALDWAKNIDLKDYLDRVAVGTVADLVPLKGENKILVKAGLEKLKNSKCMGLQKLLKVAKLEGRSLTPVDIGFKLAPRLNAAGRVGTAYDAVHLLLTQDEAEAERLAKSLDEHNRHRQTVEQDTYAQALDFLSNRPEMQENRVLVLSGNEWPLGVIGIVASRIVRLKYRPTFVLSEDSELCKGSARSIRGFHLCQALKHCEDLLEGYGGHAYAAGIKIKSEKINSFRERINAYADQLLKEEDLIPFYEIDAEIQADDISLKLAEELEQLGPFGQENPVPLLMGRGLTLAREPQIVGQDHLKIWIQRKAGGAVEGIGFGMASWRDFFKNTRVFQAVFEISVNDYAGNRSVQIQFKDFKADEGLPF